MHSNQSRPNRVQHAARWLGAALMAISATWAQAITINVVSSDPTRPFNVPFRWTLQEDQTFRVVPGVTGTNLDASPRNTLSLQFHKSYMPVVEAGQTLPTNTTGVANTATTLVNNTRYFLSVLPGASADGSPAFEMAGVSIQPNAGGTLPATVRVVVNPTPIRTSQVSVLVFHDSNPINNQISAMGTQEFGLCGFDVHIYDAGGTFGASGGRFGYDAFGNPLGTQYDAVGNVTQIGTLDMKTDANGILRVKNLAPAKYTVYAIPPAQMPPQAECPNYYSQGGNPPLTPFPTDGQTWMQTATIEGTQGVDAWVKANGPAFFDEGPLAGGTTHHVQIGFVPKFATPLSVTGGNAGKIVTGRVINVHNSRPPVFTFHSGLPVGSCRIGLNQSTSLAVGGGTGVWAGECNPDGTFSIPGLLPNTRYQLAVWDKALGNVFGLYDFITAAGATGTLPLGDVPVFNWFGKLAGKVCHDPLETGACSATSVGIPGQAVNLRFRDGSLYQSVATDNDGDYEFPEIFPFFNWLVAEVDFLRFKATGVTAMPDAGGLLPTNPVWPNRGSSGAASVPQTEAGEFILQGLQVFLGQTNIMDWGKTAYVGTENGGISGKINYSSTRAESDPRYAGAENNEPGIPRVAVRLYEASAANPRVPLNPIPIAEAASDSWDDAIPTGCTGPAFTPDVGGTLPLDCFDGMRNYNQTRLAVYDGGYAFTGLPPGYYIVEVVPPTGYEVQKEEDKNVDFGDSVTVSTLALPPECVGERPYPVPAELDLFPGVAIPPEYRDRLADGSEWNQPTYAGFPANGKKRPMCDRKAVTLTSGLNAAMDFHLFTKTPVAGHIVGIILDDLSNEFNPAAPSFGEKFAPPFMPVSVRDHTGREITRVYSDRFGQYNALVPSTFTFNVPMPSGIAPNMLSVCLNTPYMPVKDANGNDVLDPITGRPVMQPDPNHNKSYAQACRAFNFLPGKTTYLDTPTQPIAAFTGPQQFSLDCAHPDAVPGIRSVNNALNSGPWVPTTGNRTLTIRSMGSTQVINPLWEASNPGGAQPKTIARDFGFGAAQGTGGVAMLNAAGNPVALTVTAWSNDTITATVPAGITAAGTLLVTRGNGNVTPRGVTVHVGGATPIVVAAGGSIQAAINTAPEGSLITVQPGVYEEQVIVDRRVRVQGFGAGSTLINAANQPVQKVLAWREAVCTKLFATTTQNGPGPGAAFLLPGQALPADLQTCIDGNTADNAPLVFANGEVPGFFVMIKSNGNADPQPRPTGSALRIDGFTVTGASNGGGINVNGYAAALQISNNVITGNQGIQAGGIRLGDATLVAGVLNPDGTNVTLPVASRNVDVSIRNNEIVQNGDMGGAFGAGGGGIGIFNGSSRYNVTKNFVCGNFSTGNGGGLGHLGVSHDSVIHDNKFYWNQSFYQQSSMQGGGISIAGLYSALAADGLSTGSGTVRISSNTIHGNLAGAGDGGGISLVGTNGNTDLGELGGAAPNLANVYLISLVNNVIVNNVAGVAGGGIALRDAPNTQIINNTIARNDNTSTAARAFALQFNTAPGGALNSSTRQLGAGIASYPHSPVMIQRLNQVNPPASISRAFSGPAPLDNNILYQNRVFHWNQAATPTNPVGLMFDGFSDLDVLDVSSGTRTFAAVACPTLPIPSNCPGTYIPSGTQARMVPTNTLMTNISGYVSNATNPTEGNLAGTAILPQYVNANTYNGGPGSVLLILEASVQATTQAPAVAAAFDEGGNFIDVRFGPLTQRQPPAATVPYFDYRLLPISQAVNLGRNRLTQTTNPINTFLQTDRNGVARPTGGTNNWDSGAYHRSAILAPPAPY
jgi:large repetitive protein